MMVLPRKIFRLSLIALVTTLIFSFVLGFAVVRGQSMKPTYRDGDWVLINRLSYLFRPPTRGEVVAIKLAGRRLMLLKRIIGLPGETVEIHSGQVFIDGWRLSEPYLVSFQPWGLPPRVLVAEEYFVIGDNRQQPAGEHFFGRVDGGRIVGRALW